MKPTVHVGTYTGTGAALDLPIGFVPDYVRVCHITDGDESFEWFRGMTDGHAFQTVNHDTAQQSVITSNGVSALDGANGAGFTVGTALSTSAKVYRYVAVRNA